MTLAVAKYARRPFEVDAVQVTNGNMKEIAKWCNGEIRTEEKRGKSKPRRFIKVFVQRPMSERQSMAFVGDWVLYAGTGFKIYPDNSFHQTFALADPLAVVEQTLAGVPPRVKSTSMAQAFEKMTKAPKGRPELPPKEEHKTWASHEERASEPAVVADIVEQAAKVIEEGTAPVRTIENAELHSLSIVSEDQLLPELRGITTIKVPASEAEQIVAENPGNTPEEQLLQNVFGNPETDKAPTDVHRCSNCDTIWVPNPKDQPCPICFPPPVTSGPCPNPKCSLPAKHLDACNKELA